MKKWRVADDKGEPPTAYPAVLWSPQLWAVSHLFVDACVTAWYKTCPTDQGAAAVDSCARVTPVIVCVPLRLSVTPVKVITSIADGLFKLSLSVNVPPEAGGILKGVTGVLNVILVSSAATVLDSVATTLFSKLIYHAPLFSVRLPFFGNNSL